MGILTTVDLAIIAVFAALLLLYKVVRDWYGIREVPGELTTRRGGHAAGRGILCQARAAVKFIDFAIEGRRHRQKVKADLVVRRDLRNMSWK